jgi:uncharacterized protein (TIGR02118 family)
MVTRFSLVPRKKGLTVAEFQTYWREHHGVLAARLPGVVRYWQNHAISRSHVGLPWPGFDLCAELDAADVAAYDAMFSTPLYRGEIRVDEGNLIDRSGFGVVLCERVATTGEMPLGGVRLLTFMRCAPLWDAGALAHALCAQDRGVAVGREVFCSLQAPQAGQRASVFDAIEALWFDRQADAESYLRSAEMPARRRAVAGIVQGTERLVARVHRVV